MRKLHRSLETGAMRCAILELQRGELHRFNSFRIRRGPRGSNYPRVNGTNLIKTIAQGKNPGRRRTDGTIFLTHESHRQGELFSSKEAAGGGVDDDAGSLARAESSCDRSRWANENARQCGGRAWDKRRQFSFHPWRRQSWLSFLRPRQPLAHAAVSANVTVP